MKKICIFLFIGFLATSQLFGVEQNPVINIIKSISDFIMSPSKKKEKFKIIELNTLNKYKNTQKNFYITINDNILSQKEKNDEMDPNLYLEKSIIETIKGNKEKADFYANKAYEKDLKKEKQEEISTNLSEIKKKIKNKSNNEEDSTNEEFIFDENLTLMLANEFTDQYEVSIVKVSLVKSVKRNLSDKELQEEMKRTADKFYSKISNGVQAKALIEKCISDGEFEIALDILERSYNDTYIEEEYYKVTKLRIETLIGEREKRQQQLEKIRMEEDKKIKAEEDFLTKLYEEEKRKKELMKKNKWTALLGTKVTDSGQSIAIGIDGIFVTGYTYGGLYGNENQGDSDIYVMKVDFAGQRVWTKQFGSTDNDGGTGICAGKDGIYVTGYTRGDLDGQKNNGEADVFITKYDFNGSRMWTRLLGTPVKDKAKSITIADDGIYITGTTEGELDGQKNNGFWDIFVAKYDFNGNKKWTKMIGSSSHDEANGISAIDNYIYVVGQSIGNIDGLQSNGQSDIYIAKLNSSGNKIWSKLVGTKEADYAYSVSAGLDGVYITGESKGNFAGLSNKGDSDVVIMKYDVDGNRKWVKLLGTQANDYGYYIFARLDSVYVTGRTKGSFEGFSNNGGADIFLAKYDTDGNKQFVKMYGTPKDDECYGLCVGLDFYYITGETRGNLNDQNNIGGLDTFIVMLSDE